MRVILCLLFFFACLRESFAQDPVILSTDLFDDKDQIALGSMNGWLYREGHDPSWVNEEIELNNWKKLNPTELTAKNDADKNAKAEGWFRIKIKLDSTFNSFSPGLLMDSWAAADIYFDGKLRHSFGNTGANGVEFKGHFPANAFPVNTEWQAGEEHLIAIHLVDRVSPISKKLRSEELLSYNTVKQTSLNLTGKTYAANLSTRILTDSTFQAIWFTTLILLSVFFWLMAYLNPDIKNLRLIALCTNIIFLANFSPSTVVISKTFLLMMLRQYASGFFWGMMICIIPIVVSKLIKDHIPGWLKIFFFIIPVSLLTCLVMHWNVDLPYLLGTAVSMFYSLYIIISSWKKIRNAQWAVVMGLLITLATITISGIVYAMSPVDQAGLINYFGTFLSLSFPISLLVYVALQYKTILTKIKENAMKIVEVSEEKKQILARQNEILEKLVHRS